MHTLATRIDAVTVYRSGARVRRVGDLAPDAQGRFPDVVQVGDLPLCLDDSSLRLRVEPQNGAHAPVASDLRVALALPEIDADLPPVDDERVETARRDERRAKLLVDHLESELSMLAASDLGPRPDGPEGEPPGPSPFEARLAFASFRAEREATLQDRLAEARLGLWEAREQLRREQDRYARESSRRRPQSDELRKAAVVTLRAPASEGPAGPARVVVEYLVPGASWAPAYTLRLAPNLTSARLALRALVAQRTGEDWERVEMTLSTAEPQAFVELPELASQRIGRRQPRSPKRGWRPAPIGTDELFDDWDRAFAHRLIGAGGGAPPEMAVDEAYPRPSPTPATATFSYGAGLAEPEHARHEDRAVPPPAPQAVPVELSEMPRARSKSAGRLEAFASVAAAPATLAVKGISALAGGGGMQSRPGYPPPGAPASGAWDAAASAPPEPGDLLRYGDLRLAPPSSPQRGHLVLASRQTVYLELVVQQDVRLELPLDDLLSRHRTRADVSSALPAGHRIAWSEHYDYAYVAEAPVDIVSDGVFHGTPLMARDADAAPRYVVVPRESTDVFRLVDIDNPLDAPLLPGPVDVYVGGRFLLSSEVDFTPPGGGFDLGLGVEQGIKAARNTRYREESGGFVSKQLELHHAIAIELRNNLDRPALIEVRERVPVTREGDDEVEVEVRSVEPPWEDYEPEPATASQARLRGGYRWSLTVPAGGSRTLEADYVVTLSGKYELVGGNRREA